MHYKSLTVGISELYGVTVAVNMQFKVTLTQIKYFIKWLELLFYHITVTS